jgi:hypothetical protein
MEIKEFISSSDTLVDVRVSDKTRLLQDTATQGRVTIFGFPRSTPSNFSPGLARAQFTGSTSRADYMICKSDQIRAAWVAGDQIEALRIAARFFDRSSDTKTIKRGIDAYNNPSFYRQLGKDPEQIIGAALDILAKRFNLH